jgi:uncharacterized protein (TIGR03083 family)
MDRSTHLEALAADAAAFYTAAERAPLDTRIRACPEWTMADLVFHLGEVHHFWCEVTERQAASPDGIDDPPRPSPDALVAWGRAEAHRLQEILSATDPATPLWTWAPQKDVAFIVRRMAQETAVHRWDAEEAVGRPASIEPELASDGIDEYLAFFLPRARKDAPPLAGSVHLHVTDTPGEWLIRPGGGGEPVVSAEHAKGDVAVRGPASDLLLLLWRRKGLDGVEVLGDRALAEAFVARTNNG